MKKLRIIYNLIKNYTLKHPIRTISILFLCIISLPIMVVGFVAISTDYKASLSGVIGDTVGGITSPLIGLLSAYLVFISFQEQVKANKLITRTRREDLQQTNISNWIERNLRNILEFEYKNQKGKLAVISITFELRTAFLSYINAHNEGEEVDIEITVSELNSLKLQEVTHMLHDIYHSLRYMKEQKMKYKDCSIHLFHVNTMLRQTFYHIPHYLKFLEEVQTINDNTLSNPYTRFDWYNRCKDLIEEIKKQ